MMIKLPNVLRFPEARYQLFFVRSGVLWKAMKEQFLTTQNKFLKVSSIFTTRRLFIEISKVNFAQCMKLESATPHYTMIFKKLYYGDIKGKFSSVHETGIRPPIVQTFHSFVIKLFIKKYANSLTNKPPLTTIIFKKNLGQWNVMQCIRRVSNFVFFAPLYCSCLGFTALQ